MFLLAKHSIKRVAVTSGFAEALGTDAWPPGPANVIFRVTLDFSATCTGRSFVVVRLRQSCQIPGINFHRS